LDLRKLILRHTKNNLILKKSMKVKRARFAPQTIVLNYYPQLQKTMATKEALLLLLEVMAQETTLEAILIIQVTWLIQNHPRQKLDL
jgi:hypothetical protein